MITISSVTSPSVYGKNTPATSASGSANQKPDAGSAQLAASLASVENTLAFLGGSSSSPLTYNAAGLLNSSQQTASTTSAPAKTSVQAAQEAVLAAENAVTETLNSLLPDPSSGSPHSRMF